MKELGLAQEQAGPLAPSGKEDEDA